jgi:hypothetical protein
MEYLTMLWTVLGQQLMWFVLSPSFQRLQVWIAQVVPEGIFYVAMTCEQQINGLSSFKLPLCSAVLDVPQPYAVASDACWHHRNHLYISGVYLKSE